MASPPTTDRFRAAGYARVSTTGQAEHGLSLPEQEAKIRAYAEWHGWDLVEIYSEPVSAIKVDFANRPEATKALARAAELDRLIVAKHDRLGRNARDSLNTFDAFERHGCDVVSIAEDFTNDGMGRVLRTMLAAFAEYEGERFKQRGKDGAAAKARAGRPNGGKRPYGLRYVGDGNGLEVVASEKPIVSRIFAEFVAGRSRTAVARDLEREGVPTATGGRWRDTTISGILKNTKHVRYDIVDQGTFDRAQQLIPTLSRRRTGRKPSANHLFVGGTLRCECGEAMNPRTKGGHSFYYCGGRHKYGTEFCPMPASIRRQLIDGAVFDYFAKVGLDVEASRAQLAEARDRKLAEVSALREQAHAAVVTTEAQMQRVRSDYLDGKLSAGDWAEFRDELAEKREGANAEAARLDKQHQRTIDDAEAFDAEADVLAQLSTIRKAIAGEVKSAEGVDAVRAALSQLFTGFVLHPRQNPRLGPQTRDEPVQRGRSELVDVDDFMIELTVNPTALEGYDENLFPVLTREALGHNSRDGLPIR